MRKLGEERETPRMLTGERIPLLFTVTVNVLNAAD